MPDSIRSLMLRAAVAACLILTAVTPALAQHPPDAPSGVQFLSRYDFTMSAAALSGGDERFSWDTHWAGDFDLVDYGSGRATFLCDYQALLGNEFRPFDPYQSSYLLEASGSVRLGRVEVAGVLNHVSRHLGDRFKRIAVAENSLGVRVIHEAVLKRDTSVALRVDVRKVIARAYVDYTWMGGLDLTVRRTLTPRTSLYGQAVGEGYTVDPAIAGRTHQYGGRAEVGVQLKGVRGNLELFGGAERVIDADLLDRVTRRWAFFGFRIVGG